jgi:hypothetical protein
MVGEKSKGSVFVFGVHQRNIRINTLTSRSVQEVTKAINQLGRFVPEDSHRVENAMRTIVNQDVYKRFSGVSKNLGLDLYISIVTFRRGQTYYGEMRIIPLNQIYGFMRKTIRVRSRVSINLPVKLAREIARLHKKIPLHFTVLQKIKEGEYRISAGQWHGLSPKTYMLKSGRLLTVKRLFRYESVVSITGSHVSRGIIPIYPETASLLEEMQNDILWNTVYKYSMAHKMKKGSDPKKKFVESLAMNLGGNIFLPVYSMFLTTGYMGMQQKEVSVAGVVISSIYYLSHFLTPEIIGGFNVSFWPWEKDANKWQGLQNLQIFLWSSLPLLFTAGYLDQLAFQAIENHYLPPFFRRQNLTAFALSFLVPGGGYFYKGHRALGWIFYTVEMGLASFSVYSMYEDYALYVWIALGVVKIVDLVLAYFIPSGYKFFHREFNRTGEAHFVPDIRISMSGSREIIAGVSAVRRF